MGRKPCVIANWKMNMNLQEAHQFFQTINKHFDWADVIICPPIYICPQLSGDFSQAGSTVQVGAQTMYFEPKGAFTGELSPQMVRNAGCSYVILGHSERRHIFGESDEEVKKRVDSAFTNELIPVICVGEKLEERESGNTEKVIKRQIDAVFPILERNLEKRFLIAYEPVWAIGTGHTATPEQAQEVHQSIRAFLRDKINEKIANTTQILYGGSVKPGNAKELYSKEDVDGFLVGGASLDPESFTKIIEGCKS